MLSSDEAAASGPDPHARHIPRPSPKGKPVSLFVTCMVDMLFPATGWSTVALLEHLGVQVEFPAAQTCCGQPAFNAGHRPEARSVARQFLRAFEGAEVIVAPSGSCTAMIRHGFPTLLEDEPELLKEAAGIASRTWELTEYITEGLGQTDLGLRPPEAASYAVHDACHGLRLLGLGGGARALLRAMTNRQLHELEEADECCGFGGLFSVKMADVSGSMLRRKMGHIEACPAGSIVCGDVSCMAHINGGLARKGSEKRVQHIADVLARGLPSQAT